MDVLFRDIDMVEKVLVHEPDIAVDGIGLHRIVLIQVEGDHIPEAEPFFLMEADEELIHLGWRGSCSQANDDIFSGFLAFPYQPGNFIGHIEGGRFRILVDAGRYFFEFSGICIFRDRKGRGGKGEFRHGIRC